MEKNQCAHKEVEVMKKESAGRESGLGPLAVYFPLIRTRQEILDEIRKSQSLNDIFQQWETEAQEEFLEICTGGKGLKVLFDGIFKEIFNPEATPERLERLLSLLFGREVVIEAVLPNDSVRLGAESSLLYTDLLIQQKDGSFCNVEIQKIGYAFPGQRSACYSADHLLRQYKKVRGEKGKHFDYRKMKQVYTIVFFEHSPTEFKQFPGHFCHKFRQRSDTGLELELLQEYFFLPLDIFRKSMENKEKKEIGNELEAWLVFLSFDEPEWIIPLIRAYPQFRAMYQQMYEICLNMEKVMSVYSKELAELDKNTVRYMMDEMQAELDRQASELEESNRKVREQASELEKMNQLRIEQERRISELEKIIRSK
ncbi:MAG: PD-(D/E)XK nuclease family transposase [Clostridium sp.]|nr:Rpn family recombination-promoting nuclease/putative transposase [Clostridiaceae bacterium]MDD6074933.1 PD-(D/E)XK nuclease family transposase [Clostridium sp.]MDY5483721.1 PD-(D/E)XK nuclease family transposase [Clostridium sp.]